MTPGCCIRCPVPDEGEPVLFDRKPAPPKGSPAPAPRRTPAPADGPGSELARVITEHRLTRDGCGSCRGLEKQMNRWGTAGCRDRREQILTRLRKAYKELSAAETAGAAWTALWSGLAFKLTPLDPAPGLLDEALRRWEAKTARESILPPPARPPGGETGEGEG